MGFTSWCGDSVASKRLIGVALLVSVLFISFRLTRVNNIVDESHLHIDLKKSDGVININDIPREKVNHKDAVGAFKQVIIQKGKVPALNMFGRATINPNGNVPKHTHANMDEIFYCVKGSGQIIVDNQPQTFELDITIHVSHGKKHSVVNLDDTNDLVFLYFGIAV